MAESTKKIAVTATSGGLGKLVVQRLGEFTDKANIVAVARDPAKCIDESVFKDIEVRAGDYANPSQLTEAFSGIDVVVFISSPAGPDNREELHKNVVAAAKTAGVRKIIYSSVIGNGDEMNTLYAPMAAINRQAEDDIKQSGMEWIAARNGLYLEFDVAHILNAAEEGVFRNNGGDGYCCYITRNEIALAYAVLATSDRCNNRVLNIVGDAYKQSELVEIVNAQAETDVNYEAISDEECLAKITPVRGEVVAAMLTGCYQAIRAGAFDVPSDYEEIVGTPCKPMQFMIAEVVRHVRAGQTGR